MQLCHSDIAVVLFARDASVEAKQKRFYASQKQNNIFWNRMDRRIVSVIQKTNLDYFRYSQNDQKGNTFGEKVSYVLNDVFSKGYDKVIVVGNDCADINENDILESAKGLSENQIIVGADKRGGAYLIGLQKEAFNAQRIEQLAWNSSRLLDSIAQLQFSTAFIENKDDLNFKHEFQTLKGRIKALRVIIKDLFASFFVFNCFALRFQFLLVSSYSRRGPPVYNPY